MLKNRKRATEIVAEMEKLIAKISKLAEPF